MSCSLDGLFPASEARVHLALGDERLHPDVLLEGDALRATATATASAEQEGARQLVCSVSLGGESREAWQNLTVYSKRERAEPEAREGGAESARGSRSPDGRGPWKANGRTGEAGPARLEAAVVG